MVLHIHPTVSHFYTFLDIKCNCRVCFKNIYLFLSIEITIRTVFSSPFYSLSLEFKDDRGHEDEDTFTAYRLRANQQ